MKRFILRIGIVWFILAVIPFAAVMQIVGVGFNIPSETTLILQLILLAIQVVSIIIWLSYMDQILDY